MGSICTTEIYHNFFAKSTSNPQSLLRNSGAWLSFHQVETNMHLQVYLSTQFYHAQRKFSPKALREVHRLNHRLKRIWVGGRRYRSSRGRRCALAVCAVGVVSLTLSCPTNNIRKGVVARGVLRTSSSKLGCGVWPLFDSTKQVLSSRACVRARACMDESHHTDTEILIVLEYE